MCFNFHIVNWDLGLSIKAGNLNLVKVLKYASELVEWCNIHKTLKVFNNVNNITYIILILLSLCAVKVHPFSKSPRLRDAPLQNYFDKSNRKRKSPQPKIRAWWKFKFSLKTWQNSWAIIAKYSSHVIKTVDVLKSQPITTIMTEQIYRAKPKLFWCAHCVVHN